MDPPSLAALSLSEDSTATRASALREHANALFVGGDPAASIPLYSEALALLAPMTDVPLLANRAAAHLKLGKWAKACELHGVNPQRRCLTDAS